MQSISEAELIELENLLHWYGDWPNHSLCIKSSFNERIAGSFRKLIDQARAGALCENCGTVIRRAALPDQHGQKAEVCGQPLSKKSTDAISK